MWAGLVCLCLCVLPRLGQGFTWADAPTAKKEAPEPRSFASLTGLMNDTTVYLYGGFSHARSAWLNETWKLQDTGTASQWTKFEGEGPVQHATLVTLDGVVLLVGGKTGSGQISNEVYFLNISQKAWQAAQVQNGSVPSLYRHAAISYTVNDSARVLLCGGLDENYSAVDFAYELSYNASSRMYVFTSMRSMPKPLFGHSLAMGPDSEVYVSGGLSGSFNASSAAAVPSGLGTLMSGAQAGSNASVSASVFLFRPKASEPESWTEVCTSDTVRPLAFHASWVIGDALYLHGGTQGQGNDTNSDPSASRLQVIRIPDTGSDSCLSNVTEVTEVLRRWGEVQPGSLSGAALWVNNSNSQTRVWLFGGWATPQPLPSWGDSYLSRQDSSLTWRMDGSGPEAARWLAPLQGGMAPRGAAGLMAVPVTVGGARKLLVMGGHAAKNWTGTVFGSTNLSYSRGENLPLPFLNDPLDSAMAYQLHDIWLIDQITGEREEVWYMNSSLSPFGSWKNPTVVGRLWDRRLLETHEPGANPGGSATAVYLQAEEVVDGSASARLQPGIWNLTLSVIQLIASDGPFNATVATWRSLLPNATTSTPPDNATCYPRVLYGAAHLVSTVRTSTSYIALHGGLFSSSSTSLWDTASSSVCLLELDPTSSRWLAQPDFGYAVPKARYRHACASRAGLSNYSMTCYGGLDPISGDLLEDAWTLTLQDGVEMPPTTFIGDWLVAPANYTALRPGPRVDHWMLSIRGAVNSSTSFPSPLILIGGKTAATSAMAPVPPRQALWLLDAAACPDPDAYILSSGFVPRQYRRAQVWLSLLPKGNGDDELTIWAARLAQKQPPLTTWALATAAHVQTESHSELWLLLAEAGEGAVGDVRALKAVTPSNNEGCFSTILQLDFCRNLSYSNDAVVKPCWPGATLLERDLDIKLASKNDNTLAVLASSGGCTVLDPDGASVPFTRAGDSLIPCGSKQLSGVWLPPGVKKSELTVVAYGNPYIYLANTTEAENWTLSVPSAYMILLKLRLSNGMVLSNVTTELRVRGPDGLDRKRRSKGSVLCAGGPATTTVDADTCTTNSTGVAGFYAVNTSVSDMRSGNVSYVVFFTLQDTNASHSVVLKSPWAAARTTSVEDSGNGVSSALLEGPDGTDVTYNITVSSMSFKEVSFNITFQSPNGTARPAGNQRGWTAKLFQNVSGNFTERSSLAGAYAGVSDSKLHLPPGSYFIADMRDNTTNTSLNASQPSFTVEPGGTTVEVPVVVPMSSVLLYVRFDNVLVQEPAASLDATRVMIQMDTMMSTSKFWAQNLMDKVPWKLIPGLAHRAVLSLADGPELLTYNFIAPKLEDGKGGYERHNVTLPHVLLCSSPTTNNSTSRKGNISSGAKLVYYKDVNCSWSINTGQPVTHVRFNLSSLNSKDSLVVSGGNKQEHRPSVKEIVVVHGSVTISFTAGSNGIMDYFEVEWEGGALTTSMPPQFIMMIAASSAAAGAMLLFLCLWHCVFRPVQMRRQQFAAAMAAAANAAANATGNPPGARGANRNRVPRRYLRMMPTSVYSVKDAATAAAAASVVQSPVATSAMQPIPKDSSKFSNDGDVAKDADADAADAAAAAAEVRGLPGQGTTHGVALSKVPERLASAAAAAKSRVTAAGGQDTAAPAVGPVPTPPPPPSSSGPASHSDPEASGGEVCSICLCEFEDGERIKHLPCKHFYHVVCIDQWLGRDITCPLCKDNVLEGLKNLFGPLPLRATSARQGHTNEEGTTTETTVGEGDTGTVAGAAGMPAAGDGAIISGGAGTVISGGGNAGPGGGGAGTGADLEMVVILPYDPAVTAAGGNGSGHVRMPTLPGSVAAGDAAQQGGRTSGLGSPLTNATTAAAGAASSASNVPVVLVLSAAEGAFTGGGGIGVAGNPTVPTSSSYSRELRPMRRNISADLTAEQDGTSSDCDSGDDSEYDMAPRQAYLGTSTGVAAVAADPAVNANSGARVFQMVSPPAAVASGSGGAATADASAGGVGGNQFVLSVVLPQSLAQTSVTTGGSGASYFETAGLSPSSRPVVEHVQRSTFSSSNSAAVRWIPTSSQVAPVSRAAAALAAGPAVHRLARAQEAQMAVAAAAISAAAAGVSNRGVSNGAGSSNGGAGATNSWRTASSTSACGSGACFDGATSTTAAGVLSYRVHNNPLALGSTGSRSDVSSPQATDTASASAFVGDRPSGPASPRVVAIAAAAFQGACSLSAPPHNISALHGSHLSNQFTGHAVRPRRASSTSSSAGMQPRAVPEVSASCEDVVRVGTSASAFNASQQQQQP